MPIDQLYTSFMSSQLVILINLLDFSILKQDQRKSYWVPKNLQPNTLKLPPAWLAPQRTETSAQELIGRSKPVSIEHGRDLEATEYPDHGWISTHSDLHFYELLSFLNPNQLQLCVRSLLLRSKETISSVFLVH